MIIEHNDSILRQLERHLLTPLLQPLLTIKGTNSKSVEKVISVFEITSKKLPHLKQMRPVIPTSPLITRSHGKNVEKSFSPRKC
jgi:hypothetical protein